jgi:TolB-like protein/DNA-binding winged helix-turn-helix (wHTH) protein/Tfp pilus assembly protein PilF
MSTNHSYSFGEYTLDLTRGALLRSGADVRLRPKSFEVLRLLIERHGELVTKDELLDAVWGRTVVTEGSVVQCLRDARRAIGDESQQMIRTVPRRGYVFALPVAVSDGATQECALVAPASAPPRAPSSMRGLRQGLFATLLISLVPVAIWWGFVSRGTDAVPPAEYGATRPPHNSIAVLPFANMSGDSANEYLCDGISEEILNRLASFPELHVIARTSSFALKDSGFDVPKLTGLLGVRYLLQGSVRREGDTLRIAAQLVDESGVQVWGNTYDRELTGIFGIQQEIAGAVATNVVPKIAAARSGDPELTPNLDAYQHYMAGRELLYQRRPGFLEPAEQQLKQAVAIDPQYAEAHAELAILWALTAGWYRDLDETAQQAERARKAIDRALSIKPDLARAYAAQGLLLRQRYPPDYARSETALRHALALDPNMVDASNWLAGALKAQGRFAEGFAVLERAARIDPLASPLMDNLASDYAERGDFMRAEQSLRRLLELPQPSFLVHWTLADLYFWTGRLVESHAMVKRLVLSHAEFSEPANWYAVLALSYARLGLWKPAEYWLKRQERAGPQQFYAFGLNRAELLRLQGRYQDMVVAPAAALESAGGERSGPALALDYGILQALAGDYSGAIRTLASPLAADKHRLGDVNARHALAWAYLNTGATDRAHSTLSDLDRQYRERHTEGWLHVSADLALFAQNALLAGDRERAIARFAQAVAAGWRDYYSVSNDPRWRPLTDQPRFKELMTIVKADVDAQRAQVERIEAADDFVARHDRVLEDREAGQPASRR